MLNWKTCCTNLDNCCNHRSVPFTLCWSCLLTLSTPKEKPSRTSISNGFGLNCVFSPYYVFHPLPHTFEIWQLRPSCPLPSSRGIALEVSIVPPNLSVKYLLFPVKYIFNIMMPGISDDRTYVRREKWHYMAISIAPFRLLVNLIRDDRTYIKAQQHFDRLWI